jgi:hypothetical protein
MVSQKHECRFRGSLKMEDREWDWCFLYNGETSRLNCEQCQLNRSETERSRTKEIFA